MYSKSFSVLELFALWIVFGFPMRQTVKKIGPDTGKCNPAFIILILFSLFFSFSWLSGFMQKLRKICEKVRKNGILRFS